MAGNLILYHFVSFDLTLAKLHVSKKKKKMSTAPHNLDLAQALQSTGCKIFYQPPNDTNFYHVTCEMLFQSENSVSCDDDIFDFEFFFQNYHVKCKLLSHYLVINMLNKEVYNRDFDVNELKRKHSLTTYQKLNLEST